MSRKQVFDEASDHEQVGLNLPKYERDLIVTSPHVDRIIQMRIREAPPRGPVSFAFEELEDLHRGLAFDRLHTEDKKRQKSVGKVLSKIAEVLAQSVFDDDEYEDEDYDESPFDPFSGELPELPSSPEEAFETMFVPAIGVGEDRGPEYCLMLSDEHRHALLGMDTVPGEIHKMLDASSTDEQEISLTTRQFMVLTMAVQHGLADAPEGKPPRIILEIAERMSESMSEAAQASADAEDDQSDDQIVQRYRQQQQSATLAYELTITLDESRPSIWRRVYVGDCTLDVLHEIIQRAMGWENDHCHMFEWNKLRFSHPGMDLGEDLDETQMLLSTLVRDGCKKLRYWYDFGDDWWHTIKIGKSQTPNPSDQLPRCVEGAGACPPEDCGGLWGYYELLEALRDPNHERHEELSEWAGTIDPDQFDINAVNCSLALTTC
jgi:hypothetical protein